MHVTLGTPVGRPTQTGSTFGADVTFGTPSAFFYIRCILVHVTFSTPSWYTDYLFGTFLAHYNDF